MEISAEMVKSLRQQSGAGIMECKNALKETCGDIEEAVTFLRKKGLAKAEKKAGRETGDGMVCSYIHPGNKIGGLAQVLCETDDWISVPAGTPHWFDMGETPYFCTLRFFNNPNGWVAEFTGDSIAERYPRLHPS